jgi:hypothetical protein
MRVRILESLSSIVYHFTDCNNLYKILKGGKLQASLPLGTSSDMLQNKQHYYFISFTRSKDTSYRRNTCLVMDGDGLNRKYKGEAINYWGAAFTTLTKKTKNIEAEDRLYLNDPYIPVYPYLKEVHMFYFTDSVYHRKYVQLIGGLCQEHNIPCFIYNDQKEFLILNKRKVVDPSAVTYNPSEPEEEYKSLYGGVSKNLQYLYMLLKISPADLEKIKKTSYWKKDDYFAKSLSRFLYAVKHYYSNQRSDEITQIENDIHNDKNDPRVRPFLDKIIQLMKKNKLRTIKEVFEFLHNKWKDVE